MPENIKAFITVGPTGEKILVQKPSFVEPLSYYDSYGNVEGIDYWGVMSTFKNTLDGQVYVLLGTNGERNRIVGYGPLDETKRKKNEFFEFWDVSKYPRGVAGNEAFGRFAGPVPEGTCSYEIHWIIQAEDATSIPPWRKFRLELTTNGSVEFFGILSPADIELKSHIDLMRENNQLIEYQGYRNFHFVEQASQTSSGLGAEFLQRYLNNSNYPNVDPALLKEIAIMLDRIDREIYQVYMKEVIAEGNLFEYSPNDALYYNNQWFRRYLKALQIFYVTVKKNLNEINLVNNFDKTLLFVKTLHAAKLSYMPVYDKIRLLRYFCENMENVTYTSDETEGLALKLIRSVTNEYNSDEIDMVLDALIAVDEKNNSLFQTLYTEMDVGGGDTILGKIFIGPSDFDNFMKAIYSLWKRSKYNPYKTLETWEDGSVHVNDGNVSECLSKFSYGLHAAPLLDYKSDNWYFNRENFTFEFQRYDNPDTTSVESVVGIMANEVVVKYTEGNRGNMTPSTKYVLRGQYHIFQPVGIMRVKADGNVQMFVTFTGNEGRENLIPPSGLNPNQPIEEGAEIANYLQNAIPVFYLKYVEDNGNYEDAWTAIGLAVDVVSTFSGVGNLTKLRHLKLLVGSVETILGVIGLLKPLLQLTNLDEETRKNIDNFIFWSEIVTLSVDKIDDAAQMLSARRRQKLEAKKLKEKMESEPDNPLNTLPANEKNEIFDLADADDIGDLIDNLVKRYKDKLISRCDKRKDRFDIPPPPNDEQLEDIISLGYELDFDERTISDLLYIAQRKGVGKRIEPPQLIEQFQNYKNMLTLREGVPYGFTNANTFSTFKDRFRHVLSNEYGFPPNAKLAIQGSALRKLEPGDLDVGIMMTKKEAKDYWESIGMVNFIKANGDKKAEKAGMKFLSEIESDKGIVHGNEWPNSNGNAINNLLSFDNYNYPDGTFSNVFSGLGELQNVGSAEVNSTKRKINVSIIIIDSEFDLLPNLKF